MLNSYNAYEDFSKWILESKSSENQRFVESLWHQKCS